ncbi:MAG: phytoene desaturase family protein [Salinivirgaceae bacterium]|jgi:diapolycopene oxygenase|nr:phytoene desaturase family protein [Salinivirgaceae bacterium]
MKKTVVIGSGIGGLAVAIRLSAAGHAVEVYEQSSKPGGKLNRLQLGDFRFDTGPSLFTLPNLIDDLLALGGQGVTDFDYVKLSNICKYHYPDGTELNARADADAFAREANRVLNEPAGNILRYLHKVAEMYKLSAGMFVFKPFARWETFNSPEGRGVALKLHKLDMLRSMHGRNKRSFQSSKLVQLFDRYGTYNGSNPYVAPATLNMIAHLEHNVGAYFPVKGMYSIVESLVEVARKLGTVFHFNSKVDAVLFNKNGVSGVQVGAETIEAHHVISDVDVSAFYKNLMPGKRVPFRLKMMEKSTSAIIFYWGIDRTFPSLELHNIFFADNYAEEFRHLFIVKKMYADPTVYVFVSNKVTGTDAPKGSENWFVMVNAPVNEGQYSAEVIEKVKANVIRKLNGILHLDISAHIVAEKIGTPVTIEAETASDGGAIYGNSSNSRLSAFLRHQNRSSTHRGLYFVGGSVHPGGGIPLCVASANIVAEDIKNETNS